MDECCLPACSLWQVHLTLLYNPESSAHGWPAHSELGPLISISNQKKCPNNIQQINLLEAINQSRFSFQGTLKFVDKLTKITSKNRWMCPKVKGILFSILYSHSSIQNSLRKWVQTKGSLNTFHSGMLERGENSFICSYFTESCYLLFEHLLCIQQDAEWYISNNLFNSLTIVWE